MQAYSLVSQGLLPIILTSRGLKNIYNSTTISKNLKEVFKKELLRPSINKLSRPRTS